MTDFHRTVIMLNYAKYGRDMLQAPLSMTAGRRATLLSTINEDCSGAGARKGRMDVRDWSICIEAVFRRAMSYVPPRQDSLNAA